MVHEEAYHPSVFLRMLYKVRWATIVKHYKVVRVLENFEGRDGFSKVVVFSFPVTTKVLEYGARVVYWYYHKNGRVESARRALYFEKIVETSRRVGVSPC